MTSIQASSLLSSSKRVLKIPNIPKLVPRISLSFQNASTRKLVHESRASINIIPLDANVNNIDHNFYNDLHKSNSNYNSNIILQLYTILEAVSDRIEMHHNVGEQRDGWNALLLNSINMMTLAATTMSGVAAAAAADSAPLKISSTVLFSAATASLLVMNKIQPSQLAEEQRIAARLFTQLHTEIEIAIALGNATEEDVKIAIEKILAIDKAYPLPLLGGAMIEKFPSKFEPAIWWPKSKLRSISSKSTNPNPNQNNNGWNQEMEDEIREIIEVIKRKDMEDYDRLGNLALKMNKMLAISGPLLTGIAALANSEGSWGSIVAVIAGSLASAINAIEHGGQVGMVLEMYRNCGGFFKLMEETVEATLEEKNYERRENGEIFEMKMALQLGRSVSQLREFASKAALCRMEGTEIDEFASKLF